MIAFVISAPLFVYGFAARMGVNPTMGPYLEFVIDLPFRSISFLVGRGILSFAVLGAAQLLFKRFAGSATALVERGFAITTL